MTVEPTVETASEAVRAGAFDYLTKPIGKEQLLKTVANVVKVKTLDDERRRLVEVNRQYQENLEQLVDERTKALRESERHTQQQERLAAVGQLAAGIAHDFNNIMAVIVLYTQMSLRMPDIPTQLRGRLQVVDQQAARATELIQQILDFCRRAVLEPRPMDLEPFLKEIVKLLERTIPENIKMELTYGADDYTVNADPTQMQQAVMNLVVNARDAMLPKGGGKLDIELDRLRMTRHQEPPLPKMEAREWVRVTDTGIGIPPEALPHIFEPFSTTKEMGKGTGLGLAQVYGIVKQHKGHIDVATKVGGGTTFTLYLPTLLERQSAA
jgi:two-component system, cell cycle sensor histidine kinase and response regulator CckA